MIVDYYDDSYGPYERRQHRPSTERQDGIPVAVTVTSRVENLNAQRPKSTKSKSRLKMAPDPDLQPSLKMDYSDIHKENDFLDDDLEEHLDHLSRDCHRALAEQGGQVDEIRKQVELITKLQDAVNSRSPGDSSAIIVPSTTRSARYSRQFTVEEKQTKEIDFRELANATRSQMRIEAEREKFSSKNLFNVRRSKTSMGFEPTRKLLPHKVNHIIPSEVENDKDKDYAENSNNGSSAKPQTKSRSKGYLKQTLASQRGFRPMTAGVSRQREDRQDDILPPRARSAVLRSRSRRELELLSRIDPKDDEPEITLDLEANYRAISEKRRKNKLQQLQHENEELQSKVHDFLSDVADFNKKALRSKTSPMKRASHIDLS